MGVGVGVSSASWRVLQRGKARRVGRAFSWRVVAWEYFKSLRGAFALNIVGVPASPVSGRRP